MSNWNRLVNAYGPAVFATAFRILGQSGDASDVVHDVFRQAYEIHREQPVACWESLLRRLAASRSLNCLRRRAAVTAEDTPGQLRQALARLPHREAMAFCLRYLDGLGEEQVAQTLQTTFAAVSNVLHKACAQLEGAMLETVQVK
jgi:RNA polymerase sigma-70 factor (ECF subfamily)